jgi:hypothetical protein
MAKKKGSKRRPTKRSQPKRVASARRGVAKRASKKGAGVRRTPRKRTRRRSGAEVEVLRTAQGRGLGPAGAGQSGDLQGLSEAELADSESVEELVEEGQPYEASIVEGVENAPDADDSRVRTSESLEDDVPEEYRNPRENE